MANILRNGLSKNQLTSKGTRSVGVSFDFFGSSGTGSLPGSMQVTVKGDPIIVVEIVGSAAV